MALKDAVLENLGKLMQSEQAMKVLQNEAVMKAVMKAFSVSNEARTLIDGQISQVIKSFNLVTRDEVKGLQRAVERLERELGDLQARVDEAAAKAADAEDKAKTAAKAADQARLFSAASNYAKPGASAAKADEKPAPAKPAAAKPAADKAKRPARAAGRRPKTKPTAAE
jgi:polyhydroxyalkanoate synthesis regulator phasin